jgi:hypothetical protein
MGPKRGELPLDAQDVAGFQAAVRQERIPGSQRRDSGLVLAGNRIQCFTGPNVMRDGFRARRAAGGSVVQLRPRAPRMLIPGTVHRGFFAMRIDTKPGSLADHVAPKVVPFPQIGNRHVKPAGDAAERIAAANPVNKHFRGCRGRNIEQYA